MFADKVTGEKAAWVGGSPVAPCDSYVEAEEVSSREDIGRSRCDSHGDSYSCVKRAIVSTKKKVFEGSVACGEEGRAQCETGLHSGWRRRKTCAFAGQLPWACSHSKGVRLSFIQSASPICAGGERWRWRWVEAASGCGTRTWEARDVPWPVTLTSHATAQAYRRFRANPRKSNAQ